MLKNLGIGSKLIIISLIIGLVPLSIISFISLSKSKTAIQDRVDEQISYIRDVKKDQIESYLNQKMVEMTVLSKTADVVIAFRALNAYLEDWEIDVDGPFDVSYEDYDEIYNKKCAVLKEFKDEYKFQDIYLIHGATGQIMYSATRGNDIGINLKTGTYANSNLAELWSKVCRTDTASLIDIKNYQPDNSVPAMFVGSPIIDGDGNVTCVVVARIDLDQINNYFADTKGMGETGETYIVGSDKLMRSESRFASHTTGTQLIDNEAINSAFSGNSNVLLTSNYRNKDVLTAFAPLHVKGLDWAIVTEIDSDEVFASINSIENTIIIFSFIMALLVIAIGFIFSKKISKPINKVVRLTEEMNSEFEQFVNIADSISENDLTHTIESSQIKRLKVNSNDEIGKLISSVNKSLDSKDKIGQSMQKMITNLNSDISLIKNGAIKLLNDANSINSSSNNIATGANQQSERVEQISTALEEMVSTIAEMTKNASAATDSSQKASSTAATGGDIVHETIKGMNQINEVVSESAESISRLAESANQIGEIINVINDIADQTNLLALNAAIEAARAGEQGRGFAVVADEVRKLAERTSKATGEITEMINTIQSGTVEAVSSMESGKSEVIKGQELADNAGQSLNEIVSMSEQVLEMIQMIAGSTEQQSIAADEILKNIDGFTGSIKESANTASESAGTADELNSLADNLKQIVDKFDLVKN